MADKEEGHLKDNPDNPDNPEKAKVGPRLPSAKQWRKDWEDGVDAQKRKWKSHALRPKKDPIEAGVAGEDKYQDKMRKVLDNRTREKKLSKLTFGDWAGPVEATSADEYAKGAKKRGDKMEGRIEEQHELRLYATEAMDEMPTDTDSAREAKMMAARRTNIIIGEFMKGIIDLSEAKSRIDSATAA